MKGVNRKGSPHLLLTTLLLLFLCPVASCGGGGLDETEAVVDKFLRATAANDLADLQETMDPDCQEDALMALLLQAGLSSLIGGAEGEYTELNLQTTSNNGQRATVHAKGKLKAKALGTQLTAPFETDIFLIKKGSRWYVACDQSGTVQGPTPVTIPGEAVIENWKVTLLDVADLPAYGSQDQPPEGYRFLGVDLAVENIGSEVQPLTVFQGVNMYFEDNRGFTYQPTYYFVDNTPYLPPHYRIRHTVVSEVPLTAAGLTLVIEHRGASGHAVDRFDLEQYASRSPRFPSDQTAKPLGETLLQPGVISLTPLQAAFYPHISTGSQYWELYVQIRAENLYGYNQGMRFVVIQIFDGTGQVFRLDPSYSRSNPSSLPAVDGELDDIPPGLDATGFFVGTVGEVVFQEDRWPGRPQNLELLIYISEPQGPVKATPVYALYDLGEPPVIDE